MRKLVISPNMTVDGSIKMLGDWFEPQGRLLAQVAHDPTGISTYLNAVSKYVVSSTMTDPQWQKTTILSGDPVEEVRSLKEQPGKDIVLTGSITLCHTLIDAGLVNEYRLFIYTTVQANGCFPLGSRSPG